MARILYLQDYQLDFLSHTIITGLYENGHDIYEAPILNSLRSGVDEKYKLPDGSYNSYTGCPGYLINAPLPQQIHSEEEIRDILSDKAFDIIILGSLREHSIDALNRLIPSIQDREKLLIVACEGEDYSWINIQLIRDQVKPKVFFKREMKKDYKLDDYNSQIGVPTFPLPFGAFTRGYPTDMDDDEKYFDLFLSLGNTYAARSTLIEKFLEFSNTSQLTSPDRCYIATNGDSQAFGSSKYGNQIQDLLPWPDYIRRQANSKITAVIRGHGEDTLHAWEAFSFATAVLYCPTNNYIPNPPKNLRDCVFIDEECSNVQRVLETLMNEDEFRIKIAKQGKLWCRTKHTCSARAEYLVSVFEEIMAGENPKDVAENYEIY